MAAKMATIVGDVTGLQQRHHPWNIPHLVKKMKGFPLKVKSFQNKFSDGQLLWLRDMTSQVALRDNISKTPGGVPSTTLFTTGGYEFACTSES